MLTLNDCKDYKEMGLFQFGDGDYWDLSLNERMHRNFEGYKGTADIVNYFGYPYIPTLEEQIAFAVEKAKEIFKDEPYWDIALGQDKNGWELDKRYRASLELNDRGNNFFDPNPQKAMIKLQKFIEGDK